MQPQLVLPSSTIFACASTTYRSSLRAEALCAARPDPSWVCQQTQSLSAIHTTSLTAYIWAMQTWIMTNWCLQNLHPGCKTTAVQASGKQAETEGRFSKGG